METLRVALVQADLHWEDPLANLNMFDEFLMDLKDKADLVILPEMFTTGFSMNSRKLAEKMSGVSVRWMLDKAEYLNAVVAGSMIIKEGDGYYNRLLWVYPDRSLEWYDKRHLFRMGGENKFYDAGKQRLVVDYKGWRINPLICYDLRFPVWSRNRNDVDMLIYVANWPASRKQAWTILLKARAIENQVFVAGVNRVGSDGEGVIYQGDTQLINPRGDVITGFDLSYPGVTIAEISPEELTSFRKKFPVVNDADDFVINH